MKNPLLTVLALSLTAALLAAEPAHRSRRGVLGVQNSEKEGKVVVDALVPGGAAEAAGLAPGDRILEVDGKPVSALKDLVALIQGSPDKSIALKVDRNGKEVCLKATPKGKLQDDAEAQKAFAELNQELRPLFQEARKSGDWALLRTRYETFAKAWPGTDGASRADALALCRSGMSPDDLLKAVHAWIGALPPEPNLEGWELSQFAQAYQAGGGKGEEWAAEMSKAADSAQEPMVRSFAYLSAAQALEVESETLRLARAARDAAPGSAAAQSAEAMIYDLEVLAVGKIAPDFKLATLDGQSVCLSALKGKPVLLDFWASWCGPCMAEAPHVKAVHEAFAPKGLQIVGICMDQTAENGLACAQEKGLSWTHGFDGKVWQGSVVKAYGVNGIPAMFLIDAEGRIAAKGLRGDAIGEAVKKLLPAS